MQQKNNYLLACLLFFCFSEYNYAQGSKKGLIAHYLFNADAQDISGNNNHGLINGGVFTTKDRFGNACGAMQFNGTDGYIRVPHSSSLSKPQSAYTVALWFKASDGSEYSDLQWMTICCKSDIREENAASPQFRLQSTRYTVSMNTDFTENFDHQIQFDTWYHYAVTYDGDYCRVYLNNKEIVSWKYNTTFSPNQLAMEIGRDLPGNIEYFCGVMDELYLYDRALSPREVAALYNNQSERTSKKPCGQVPSVTTPQKNPNAKKQTRTIPPQQVATNVPNGNSSSQPCADPPLIVNEDTIEYQQTVVVDNPNVKLLFYDAEKEDGDIVSVNFNGAWVLERYYLKKKTTQRPKQLNLSLIPNFENYIFTKAWNLGSIPPNTLTVEIVELNSNKPPKIVNIKSNIGRSGAIKLVYKP
ncbi:MAG: LamG domain-containing protein [Aureispira sp.]